MRTPILILTASLALTTATAAHAQPHSHGKASAYADYLDREIRALSPGEQAGLEQGRGQGMALAAELNGYPGPRHVLELERELALTAAQREAVQAVYEQMNAEARALGGEIVALERELDRAFAGRTITREQLDRLTGAIGLRRARLRAVHLEAHLRTTDLLDDAQRARYATARGYTD